MTNVTKLAPAKASRSSKAKAARKPAVTAAEKRACKLLSRVLWVVGGALLMLSLAHQASGVAQVTGVALWEAWALAIAIDCGLVACEAIAVAAPMKAKQIGWKLPAAIWTMVGLSAFFNTLAFTAHAEGWMIYPAAILGVIVALGVKTFAEFAAAMLK